MLIMEWNFVPKKISVDWSRSRDKYDIAPALKRYKNFLEKKGFKQTTVTLYMRHMKYYLETVKHDNPSVEEAMNFYNLLYENNFSKSTINNITAALMKYQEMIGNPVKIKFLKFNNSLPYFFDELDVLKIFDSCNNIKHLTMLKIMFFGCLRSAELCNLDMSDYNRDDLSLRLRETKNGTDAITFINDEAARIMDKYLDARPDIKVEGRSPIFFTDYGNRWSNGDVWRMFMYYKKKAGVEKKGGVHCFSRHSSATMMIANGCDLMTVKEVLRHRDINTTLRYTHLKDEVKREKQNAFLKL